MSLLAVKAAEELSKYIVDKYHYGIECNTCQYKYAYYSRLDFISDCFDVCEDGFTVTTYDTTIDCTGNSPVFVAGSPCQPSGKIIDCNQEYVTREMQAFEVNSYMYTQIVTLGGSLRFNFVSAVVNSTSYLSGSRFLDITPSNITTEAIGSLTYITNLVDYLNSFNLPDITFSPGSSGRTMRVTFPASTTWEITANANGSLEDVTHGAKINQEGLVNVQFAAAGSRLSPPYAGSINDNWKAGYNTVFSGYLC